MVPEIGNFSMWPLHLWCVLCGQVSLLACMVLSACYWALLNMYFKELDTEGNWFRG